MEYANLPPWPRSLYPGIPPPSEPCPKPIMIARLNDVPPIISGKSFRVLRYGLADGGEHLHVCEFIVPEANILDDLDEYMKEAPKMSWVMSFRALLDEHREYLSPSMREYLAGLSRVQDKPGSNEGEPDSHGGEPDNHGDESDGHGDQSDGGGGEPDSHGGEPDNNGGESDPGGGEPDNHDGEPDNHGGASDGHGCDSDNRGGEPDGDGDKPESHSVGPDSCNGSAPTNYPHPPFLNSYSNWLKRRDQPGKEGNEAEGSSRVPYSQESFSTMPQRPQPPKPYVPPNRAEHPEYAYTNSLYNEGDSTMPQRPQSSIPHVPPRRVDDTSYPYSNPSQDYYNNLFARTNPMERRRKAREEARKAKEARKAEKARKAAENPDASRSPKWRAPEERSFEEYLTDYIERKERKEQNRKAAEEAEKAQENEQKRKATEEAENTQKRKAAEEAAKTHENDNVPSSAGNERPSKRARPLADTEATKEPELQGMMLVNMDIVPREYRSEVAQWCKPLPEHMVKGVSSPEFEFGTPPVPNLPNLPIAKRKLAVPITVYRDKIEVGAYFELDSDDETTSNKKRIQSCEEMSLYQSCYAQPAQPAQPYTISPKPDSETAFSSNNASQRIEDRPRRIPSSRLRKYGAPPSSEFGQPSSAHKQPQPSSSSRAAFVAESSDDEDRDNIHPTKPSPSQSTGSPKRKNILQHDGFRNHSVKEPEDEVNSAASDTTLQARTIIPAWGHTKSHMSAASASKANDLSAHSSSPDWDSGCEDEPQTQISVEELEEKVNRAASAAKIEARPKATPSGRFKLGFNKSSREWNGPKCAE